MIWGRVRFEGDWEWEKGWSYAVFHAIDFVAEEEEFRQPARFRVGTCCTGAGHCFAELCCHGLLSERGVWVGAEGTENGLQTRAVGDG